MKIQLGFRVGLIFYAYVGNNPLIYNDPMGEEKQLQLSVNLSGFLGESQRDAYTGIKFDPNASGCGKSGGLCASTIHVPERNSWGGGGSGGSAVGISIGESFWDTQLYLEGRHSILDSGDGAFLGIGLGLDGSTTDGPLAIIDSSTSSFRRELNAGLIAAGGAGWDRNESGDISSVGLSGGKIGVGVGFMNATGSSSSSRIATPTFGNIWDGAKSSFSQWFGSSQSSAAGGFVLYPSKINTNTVQQVYAK